MHKLNEKGLENAAKISAAFNELLVKLQDICYPGREYSITLTKLEEAAFFAKKSMASLEANQEKIVA